MVKIPVHHYIKLTEDINPDDYANFYITNKGGVLYLVEVILILKVSIFAHFFPENARTHCDLNDALSGF